MVERPESGGDQGQPGDYACVLERIRECVQLANCAKQGKRHKDKNEHPEAELDIRFSREVGACEGNLVKADQVQVGKNQSEKSKNYQVRCGLAERPEHKRKQCRDEPHRRRGEQQQ